MTSDEIKKVREAATLLLRWHVGGIESDESHPWNGMDYDDLNYEKAEAIEVVCGFARSLVGTDGEQPITEEWLREEWGFNSPISRALGHSGITGTFCFEENGLSWWHVGNRTAHITTRYQFRLLAAALGIAKKGE